MSITGRDVETRVEVEITPDQRAHGVYIIGRRGMGKSSLMESMIIEDIQNDQGVGVFDPHGSLIDRVLSRIPSNREQDVVLLDPSDTEYPFGLNLFDRAELTAPEDYSLTVDTIVDVFKKVWGEGEQAAWGDRLEDLLGNAIYTLLSAGSYTMLELLDLLYRPAFREPLVESLANWVIADYWRYDWPKTARDQQFNWASTTNKVRQFIKNPVIQNIVGQRASTVDLAKVMNEQKILLVKLQPGKLGRRAVQLLGSMLIGQLLIAALNRPESSDTPLFMLYADEFQRFATPDFGTLIDETRKYRVAPVIAHQRRSQLDFAYQDMVRGSLNYVIFQVTGSDAEELIEEFEIAPQPGELVAKPKVRPEYKTVTREKWDEGKKEEHDRLCFEAQRLITNAATPAAKKQAQTLAQRMQDQAAELEKNHFRRWSERVHIGDFPVQTYYTERQGVAADYSTAYEWVPGPMRPVSDVRNELMGKLTSLPRGHVALRLGSGERVIQHFAVELPYVDTPTDTEKIERIRALSRQTYARKRSEVEAEIAERRRTIEGTPESDGHGEMLTEALPVRTSRPRVHKTASNS